MYWLLWLAVGIMLALAILNFLRYGRTGHKERAAVALLELTTAILLMIGRLAS